MQIPDLGVNARMDKNCLTILEWHKLATMVVDVSPRRPPVPIYLEHSGSNLQCIPISGNDHSAGSGRPVGEWNRRREVSEQVI